MNSSTLPPDNRPRSQGPANGTNNTTSNKEAKASKVYNVAGLRFTVKDDTVIDESGNQVKFYTNKERGLVIFHVPVQKTWYLFDPQGNDRKLELITDAAGNARIKVGDNSYLTPSSLKAIKNFQELDKQPESTQISVENNNDSPITNQDTSTKQSPVELHTAEQAEAKTPTPSTNPRKSKKGIFVRIGAGSVLLTALLGFIFAGNSKKSSNKETALVTNPEPGEKPRTKQTQTSTAPKDKKSNTNKIKVKPKSTQKPNSKAVDTDKPAPKKQKNKARLKWFERDKDLAGMDIDENGMFTWTPRTVLPPGKTGFENFMDLFKERFLPHFKEHLTNDRYIKVTAALKKVQNNKELQEVLKLAEKLRHAQVHAYKQLKGLTDITKDFKQFKAAFEILKRRFHRLSFKERAELGDKFNTAKNPALKLHLLLETLVRYDDVQSYKIFRDFIFHLQVMQKYKVLFNRHKVWLIGYPNPHGKPVSNFRVYNHYNFDFNNLKNSHKLYLVLNSKSPKHFADVYFNTDDTKRIYGAGHESFLVRGSDLNQEAYKLGAFSDTVTRLINMNKMWTKQGKENPSNRISGLKYHKAVPGFESSYTQTVLLTIKDASGNRFYSIKGKAKRDLAINTASSKLNGSLKNQELIIKTASGAIAIPQGQIVYLSLLQ